MLRIIGRIESLFIHLLLSKFSQAIRLQISFSLSCFRLAVHTQPNYHFLKTHKLDVPLRATSSYCMSVLSIMLNNIMKNEYVNFYNVQTSSKYDNNLLNNNYFFILINFDINSNITFFVASRVVKKGKKEERKNSSLSTRGNVGHVLQSSLVSRLFLIFENVGMQMVLYFQGDFKKKKKKMPSQTQASSCL